MLTRAVVHALEGIEPDKRRDYAARVLIASFPLELACHAAIQLAGEGGFFVHLTTWVSWLAIQLTATDILSTTDVRASED